MSSKEKNVNPAKEKLEKDSNKTKKKEIGGPKGPEPTRYGDWEKKDRDHIEQRHERAQAPGQTFRIFGHTGRQRARRFASAAPCIK
ncbi:MAG: DUF1674 domain-containing protein, partial [Pseudomonadota bacterium]